ncbi:VanW family protein [Patescibacteria group bacterium]
MEQEEKLEKKGGRKIVVSIISGILLCGIITGAVFGFKYYVDGKLPPGTHLGTIDFSYKTKEQAFTQIKEKGEKYLQTSINISLNGKSYVATPEEMGIKIDFDKTISQLNTIDSAKTSVIDLTFNTEEVKHELEKEIDLENIYKELDTEFLLSEKAPQPPMYYFKTLGELEAGEAKNGYMLDEESFEKDLLASVNNLDSEQIELKLTEVVPEENFTQLEKEKEKIIEIINSEITLIDPIYSDDWIVKLADYPEWVEFSDNQRKNYPFLSAEKNKELVVHDALEIENRDEESLVAIKINQNFLNEYIDKEISQWLDDPAETVNIYRDEDDEIIIEGKGHDGKEVQRKKLKEAMELALEKGINKVTIPVKEIKAILEVSDDLKELGITEKISVGHTAFYGSTSGRKFNVGHGASQFHGTLVAPGEEFSFNERLGPVDYANGYKAALVIKGGDIGTVPEPGGGICQVSTTMYRTALFAGFPITERHPHSYKVSYYSQVLGDGLDATIYLGGPNLKFMNDTKDHVLIQTYVEEDGYELYIVFYGTNPDGREIELEGPYLSNYRGPGPTVVKETPKLAPGARKQVEVAHTGFDATWYRHIRYEDGTVNTEQLDTRYKAIAARILVGAGAVSSEEE